MIQDHLWKQLFRVNVRSVYLEKMLRRNEIIDRQINMFLAIASSSSIAGWALWKEYVSVWTLVIALSQVINAILPYLPYKERIKSLSGLARDLRQLSITLESLWIDIAAGEVPENKLRKLFIEYLRKEAEYEDKYFSGKSIPEDMRLFKEAENEVKLYLSAHINSGDEDGKQEDHT